eukprot:COSAG01_NODE_2110_length_8408_cov_19.542183_4_plen_56_part_00
MVQKVRNWKKWAYSDFGPVPYFSMNSLSVINGCGTYRLPATFLQSTPLLVASHCA